MCISHPDGVPDCSPLIDDLEWRLVYCPTYLSGYTGEGTGVTQEAVGADDEDTDAVREGHLVIGDGHGVTLLSRRLTHQLIG